MNPRESSGLAVFRIPRFDSEVVVAIGVGLIRIEAINKADSANVIESITSAVDVPTMAVTAPPTTAPTASMNDHVTLPSVFAATRSLGPTSDGMIAERH